MEKSDAQLVSESSLGIHGAFEELVHRYTKPVYSFIYRLTGNAQTAEDGTQETLIKVWKSLDKYDPNQSFRAWVFTIARNTATDALRKRRTIPFSGLFSGGTGRDAHNDAPTIEDTLADDQPDAEDALARIEDVRLLESLMGTLSPDHKAVLLLHYQEELTFDEIGKVLGKPLNTVKSWHRRALLELRKRAEKP